MNSLPFTLSNRLAAECADVLACVDGSDYLSSVCDHAAWVAARCSGKLNLLTVRERALGASAPREGPLLLEAAARVHETGAEVSLALLEAGEFVRAVKRYSRPDDIIVVGRRGLSTPEGVGASVRTLIRNTDLRLLVCGRFFLPISRALILPPTGSGALFANYVASTPLLDEIEADVAVVGAGGLEVLRTGARGAYRALIRHIDYDLAVVPRSLLCGDREHQFAIAAEESLAGRRPVLIV
jgi:nucleotide-binding universal stress UspA family protein